MKVNSLNLEAADLVAAEVTGNGFSDKRQVRLGADALGTMALTHLTAQECYDIAQRFIELGAEIAEQTAVTPSAWAEVA